VSRRLPLEGFGLVSKQIFWGIAVAGASMAAAETPAPTLIGAQRVVVACELSGEIPEAQHKSICDQLVNKAKRYTSLPVALAAPGDLKLGPDMRRQADQLLLRVKGEAQASERGRKTLALEVTPVRLARPMGEMSTLKSSASLVQVQGNWVIQGPIDAFERLLAGTKKPRVPIKLDS
jgi:hypothetical protein